MRNVYDIALALCESVDTPHSLALSILIKHGEWDQISSLYSDPAWFLDSETYAYHNLISSFLKKLPSGKQKNRAREKAEELFLECENQCAHANVRIRRLSEDIAERTYHFSPHKVHVFVDRVRRRISSILGSIPDNLFGSFGPGNVFESSEVVSIPHKLQADPHLTRDIVSLIPACGDRFTRSASLTKICRGNRFTTVPKTSLSDRGICIEPSLNIYLQLPVGKIIRDRLKRATGIDLKGTEQNNSGQHLHRSILKNSLEYSTIDLSNASDTVSIELVKLLLPSDWYELLDSLRSRFTLFKGKWYKLEKFSSMGNGFTFELETLIFGCLLAEIGLDLGGNLFVYGDDILLPNERFLDALEILKYFGFTPNTKKSFSSFSLFRESCGADYFDRVPVRGIYQKEYCNEPQEWIRLANKLNRFSRDRGHSHVSDSPLRRAWFLVLSQLPSPIRRLRGPIDLGDIVIHDVEDLWCQKRINCIQVVKTYSSVASSLRFEFFPPDVQLSSVLLGVWDSPSGGSYPRLGFRGSRISYKMKWVNTGR